jgi:hypothetical protein
MSCRTALLLPKNRHSPRGNRCFSALRGDVTAITDLRVMLSP